ncbi:MAG: 16S rRNA (cytidine(1402)-2'-O)-methyltransferase [Flavobacteriales bacterium]|nr:MAG: 16S rRNA (cytidine(1402)-2'-O)-methyltransferase [Flavobacteriales bacterium]
MARLVLVPTPIGNMEDITVRAQRILSECNAVIAEDTRVTGALLHKLGIKKPLIPFHAHNEHGMVAQLTQRLLAGERLVLVSDAGTPGISDPGFLLVREAIKAGAEVECLPGPTAFVPALVASGLPCDRFVFEGFLPVKKGRQTRLGELKNEARTIVLYESPHRIVRTLLDLSSAFGAERRACVSRELSKLHEEHVRGTLAELHAHFSAKEPKGEMVVCVAGRSDTSGD